MQKDLFAALRQYSLWPLPVPSLQAFSIASAPPEAVLEILKNNGVRLNLLRQVHGCHYVELGAAAAGSTGDAWLWSPSREKQQQRHERQGQYGQACGIYSADCIPALLYHRQWRVLLHLGRRGIELGLLKKCYRALEQRLTPQTSGKNKSSWRARLFLGPGIGSCCYVVPEQMAVNFCRQAEVSAACRQKSQWLGWQMLDLKKAICEQALALPNIVSPIYIENICTSCEAQKYKQNAGSPCYSYRQGHKVARIYTIVQV